jgi:hypothetical protein
MHKIKLMLLASIRGKTVCKTLALVIVDSVEVPRSIMENSKAMALAANVFFVDGIVFLITVSKRLSHPYH